MKAAVHLGADYEKNLFTTKNTDFEQLETLFDVTPKLILEHGNEMCGLLTIESDITHGEDRL